MALIRYTASADTTIVNAFQSDLTTRGTGSNMGASDILEVFSVYGRETTSSQEISRILIKFPVTDISFAIMPPCLLSYKLKDICMIPAHIGRC